MGLSEDIRMVSPGYDPRKEEMEKANKPGFRKGLKEGSRSTMRGVFDAMRSSMEARMTANQISMARAVDAEMKKDPDFFAFVDKVLEKTTVEDKTTGKKVPYSQHPRTKAFHAKRDALKQDDATFDRRAMAEDLERRYNPNYDEPEFIDVEAEVIDDKDIGDSEIVGDDEIEL